MPYSFRSEQWLPHPVETVFAFFADPRNLPALIPPWQHARVENVSLVPPSRVGAAEPSSTLAGAGSRITLSLRPLRFLPIRVRWTAEIVDFAWNKHFCDCQIRGPFAFWQHIHSVRAVDQYGTGVTVVTDEIDYEVPLGPLGRLAHRFFLRRQIESAFAFRRQAITAALASVQPAPAPVRQETRAS